MPRTLSHAVAIAAVILALTAVSLITGPSAQASSPGGKIGHHQFFVGLVNGRSHDAIVKVVCAGPSATGRALPDQPLVVESPLVIAKDFGFTGSRGRTIATNLVLPAAAATTLTFHRYNDSIPFPTNINVPCGGTGLVIFTPIPGSHSARSFSVTVSFANVATTG
jgi:hypothetical protein